MKNVKEIFATRNRKMNVAHSARAHQQGQHGNTQSGTFYQCPMKCEGEKKYKEPGVCPVCNMHLAPVETIN
ncbi:hypothetical protein INQ51_16475 [Maribellus sp. CM-23]|uniref:heavy metal-binding domain-containing protein n=1 Tax=Maribellus sp. CM-23 TaxID=2781026 RepID=UPI001F429FDE|nr:heavy metal-binding domain-containing protein [Maribellus sp. CM-23]MCE4565916.1 hypothetical protein [Maribellus sp. CM-23]